MSCTTPATHGAYARPIRKTTSPIVDAKSKNATKRLDAIYTFAIAIPEFQSVDSGYLHSVVNVRFPYI